MPAARGPNSKEAATLKASIHQVISTAKICAVCPRLVEAGGQRGLAGCCIGRLMPARMDMKPTGELATVSSRNALHEITS